MASNFFKLTLSSTANNAFSITNSQDGWRIRKHGVPQRKVTEQQTPPKQNNKKNLRLKWNIIPSLKRLCDKAETNDSGSRWQSPWEALCYVGGHVWNHFKDYDNSKWA